MDIANSFINSKVREYSIPDKSIWWKCDSLEEGVLFLNHKEDIGVGSNDTFCIISTTEDSQTYFKQLKYQQYFKGYLVQYAQSIEHIINGYVVLTSGKIVEGLNIDVSSPISEAAALDSALSQINVENYAWEDDTIEYYLTADSTGITTYYPEGELVVTLLNDTLPMLFNNYVFAWRFQIISFDSLNPYNAFVYVNAQTGTLIKEHNQHLSGTITHPYYGSQTIDTKWHSGLGGGQYRLWADDNGLNIKTKDQGFNRNWNYYALPGDVDDVWGTSQLYPTAAHFVVTEAWDFYQDYFNRHGFDDHNKSIRVYAHHDNNGLSGTAFVGHRQRNFDEIHIAERAENSNLNATIDIASHEFAHGIIFYTSRLTALNQSGALNESYADINGFLAERWMFPSAWDWTVGEDNGPIRRSLIDPGSIPVPAICGGLPSFYPSGYKQTNWYIGTCDQGGVHVNSTVQSRCFYLLSMGGTQNGYSLTGIGIDKAASIMWYALNYLLTDWESYSINREKWVEAAIILYGKCSPEHLQTCQAWAAVNVGSGCYCEPIAIECDYEWRKGYQVSGPQQLNNPNEFSPVDEIRMFPNPISEEIVLNFNGIPSSYKMFAISLTDINGRELKKLNIDTQKELSNGMYAFGTLELNPGIYFLMISTEENQKRTFKIIKQ